MDRGLTPAIIASQRGDVKMLRLLDDLGVDLFGKNSQGRAAAEYAKDSATKGYFAALARMDDVSSECSSSGEEDDADTQALAEGTHVSYSGEDTTDTRFAGMVKDPDISKQLLEQAEDGDPVMQFLFGRWCASEQDHDQAAVWWQRSAERGCVEAQYNLSIC
jgi:TPR repeat protein